MPQQPFTILSVGGSIIIPKTGFNVDFLKNFRTLILEEVKKGKKFVLVVGGGATCRNYQNAVKQVVPISNEELDWLGIKTTVLNAEFVKNLFKNYTYSEVVTNPTKKVKTSKPIIVASGWKPGCSTDKDAVLFAKTYGAKKVVNLSNVDYVYDSDPNVNVGAKKFERLTWPELRKIVGTTWKPGANVPFDPVAAKEAERLKLEVKFVKGTDLHEVKNVLRGKAHLGTIIAPPFRS